MMADPAWKAVVEALAGDGWCVCPRFWPEDLIAALRRDARRRLAAGEFTAGHVGKGAGRRRAPRVRGDAIHWLEADSGPAGAYLAAMDELAGRLNEQLYLGLQSFEAHYACYHPGAGYRRHHDSFQGNNTRRISTLTYLNPDWSAADGGELVLFDEQHELTQVMPRAGTLVCFVSDRFPHEVRPARRERLSIAGWFRVRDITAPVDL